MSKTKACRCCVYWADPFVYCEASFLSSFHISALVWEAAKSQTPYKVNVWVRCRSIVFWMWQISYLGLVGEVGQTNGYSSKPEKRASSGSLVPSKVKMGVFTKVGPTLNCRIDLDTVSHCCVNRCKWTKLQQLTACLSANSIGIPINVINSSNPLTMTIMPV